MTRIAPVAPRSSPTRPGFRAALRASALLVGLVLSAASVGVTPHGYSSQDAPGIQVITGAQAQAAGLVARPFEMAFADGENGTELIVRYLQAARAQGAAYLSDLELRIVSGRDGTWQDCVTSVRPADRGHHESQTVMKPGHYESHMVSRPVTRQVTEHQYRCHSVSKPYTTTETHYESSYDYASKSHRSRPVTRTVTRQRMEQECRSEPVTRTVTRWEYQMESRFVPPEWRTQLSWMSAWQLEESAPVCAPIARGVVDGARPHLVRAFIYAAAAP